MRFTIRARLVSILVLTMVTLGFLSFFSSQRMASMNMDSTIIATELIPLIEEASDMKANMNEYRNLNYRHILSTSSAEMDTVEKSMADTIAKINDLLTDYKTKIKTDEEKTIVSQVEKTWAAYTSADDAVIAESRKNDFQGAFKQLVAIKSSYDAAMTEIDKLILFNHDMSQNASTRSNENYLSSRTLIFAVVLIALVILVSFQLYVIMSVTRPLKKMQLALNNLVKNGGDLTQRIDVNAKDEIGDLAAEVNNFLANLRDIISGVLVSSNEIGHMAEELTGTVTNLNYEIEEISSTTEELSAGLQESNATTEEINSVSQEVEQVTADIARKAEDGASNSYEISKRAESVKNMAVLASKNANEVYDKSNQRLLKAMKDAKAVENINVLAESILGITNQTNLLALNAAIEAARAGQAGRGFAVVADEIRKLAEESKESANQIQEVTGVIVEAVRFLSESASEILGFIDGQVKKDYDKLVEVAEQYKDDADFVTNMSTDLSASAEELSASLQNIVHSISEISKATEESAAGATNIANRTTNILGSAQNVSELTEGTRVNVKELIELISKFKV